MLSVGTHNAWQISVFLNFYFGLVIKLYRKISMLTMVINNFHFVTVAQLLDLVLTPISSRAAA